MTPDCEVSIEQVAAAPVPLPVIAIVGTEVYPAPAFFNNIPFIE